MAERDTILTELKLAGQRAYSAGMARATDSVERFDDRVGLANRRLWNMGGMASRVASVVTSSLVSIGAAATAVGASMALTGVKFNAQLESMEIGFESMLGSERAAEQMMSRILQLSKKSPFEFAGISTGVQQLVAMGVSGDQAVRTIKNIGNALAASGKGTEELQRASIQLAQMQAFGQATREDLRSLTEAGVPAFKLLRRELGLTGKELDEKLRKGALSGADAIGAINAAVEKDPTISKLMEKQSKSLAGQFSTLKDNWKITLGLMTQDAASWLSTDLLPTANRSLEFIQAILGTQNSWSTKIQQIRTVIDTEFGPIWDDLARKWDQEDMTAKAVGIGQDLVQGVARGATVAAPKVASAFWQGFKSADLWSQTVTGVFILTKLGITGRVFDAAGARVAGPFLDGFTTGVTGKKGQARIGTLGARVGGIMGRAMGRALPWAIGAGIAAAGPSAVDWVRSKLNDLLGFDLPKFGWESIPEALRPPEARALGGPVLPQMPYMVGERGPEVFVPKFPGSIISTADLGNVFGTTVVPVYLDGRVITEVVSRHTAQRMARR